MLPRRMKSGIILYVGVLSLFLVVAYTFTRRNLPMESGTARSEGAALSSRGRDIHEADANTAAPKQPKNNTHFAIGHSPVYALDELSRTSPLTPSQSNGGATSLDEKDTTPTVKKVLQANTTASARSRHNSFPRIIVVGFGKSGTRALYDALLMHPQLKGPKKEVRYFDTHYNKGLTWYLEQMPSAEDGVVVIEKSPSYIIHPISAQRLLEAVEKLNVEPSTLKFVVMVRDPITRAVSEYLEWNLQRLYFSRNDPLHRNRLPPFEKMVYDESGQIDLAGAPMLNASVYSFHLSNWMHYFTPSQICIVDGDNFVRSPYQEIHSLESCLGLKRYFTEQNFEYVPQRGFYCFRETSHSTLQCESQSKGRPHPTLPEQVVLDLKKAYQPYNEQLQVLTNRTYSWF